MHFANYIVLGLLIAFTPRKKFAVAARRSSEAAADWRLGDGVVTRAIATAFARFFRPLQLPPPRLDRPSKLKEDRPIAPKRTPTKYFRAAAKGLA